MKLQSTPLLQRVFEYLSRFPTLPGTTRKSNSNLPWGLLLSSFNARVSVACKKLTNNNYRVYFRHNFPGFARIELQVCNRMPDGSVRMLTTLYASGYARNMLSDGRNILVGGPGGSISILSISVRYIAYGVTYQLHIDTAEGTQKLLKEGKPYPHGPQYTLALRSLPLISITPAPITTPTNGRPGMLPLALAAC